MKLYLPLVIAGATVAFADTYRNAKGEGLVLWGYDEQDEPDHCFVHAEKPYPVDSFNVSWSALAQPLTGQLCGFCCICMAVFPYAVKLMLQKGIYVLGTDQDGKSHMLTSAELMIADSIWKNVARAQFHIGIFRSSATGGELMYLEPDGPSYNPVRAKYWGFPTKVSVMVDSDASGCNSDDAALGPSLCELKSISH